MSSEGCGLYAVKLFQHYAGYGQGVHKEALTLGKTRLSSSRVDQAGKSFPIE